MAVTKESPPRKGQKYLSRSNPSWGATVEQWDGETCWWRTQEGSLHGVGLEYINRDFDLARSHG